MPCQLRERLLENISEREGGFYEGRGKNQGRYFILSR